MAKIKSSWERVVSAQALTADWMSLASSSVDEDALTVYRVVGSLPSAMLAATLTASSTSLNPAERDKSVTRVSPMVVEASDRLFQSVRQSIRSLTGMMAQVTEEELSYEHRTAAIGAIADYVQAKDPDAYEDAVRRMINAQAHGVPDEVTAALIRYLSVQDLVSPGIISALLTSLESGSEIKAVAAARTLGDIADSGALPRFKSGLARLAEGRVKEEGMKAIKSIDYAPCENP